jgi:hypothetical protein
VVAKWRAFLLCTRLLTQCMFEGGKKVVKYLLAGSVAGWGALPLSGTFGVTRYMHV